MIFKGLSKENIEKKEPKKIVRKLRNVRFSKFALFAEIAEIAIDDKHHTGRDSGTSRTSNSSRRKGYGSATNHIVIS
jgi:hypothetical protein